MNLKGTAVRGFQSSTDRIGRGRFAGVIIIIWLRPATEFLVDIPAIAERLQKSAMLSTAEQHYKRAVDDSE
jgi:hypothetical protein